MRRTPTALKALAGTLRRDRTNPREPKPPAGFPSAPRRMPAAVRREYDDLVALMAQMPGVATVCDVVQLELASSALAEYRKALSVVLRRGQTYQCRTQAGAVMVRTRPEVSICADAWRRAHAALQNLGLSPVARPKVEGSAPELPLDRASKPEGDAIDEFVRRRRARLGDPARFFTESR